MFTTDQIYIFNKSAQEVKRKLEKIATWAESKVDDKFLKPTSFDFIQWKEGDNKIEMEVIFDKDYLKHNKALKISTNVLIKEIKAILDKYKITLIPRFGKKPLRTVVNEYIIEYNKIHEGNENMNKKELEQSIEIKVRKILKEDATPPIYVINEFDKKTYPLMKSAINSLVETIQNADKYETDKEQYDQIISDINTAFNQFDGKLRKIITPIKDDYL